MATHNMPTPSTHIRANRDIIKTAVACAATAVFYPKYKIRLLVLFPIKIIHSLHGIESN